MAAKPGAGVGEKPEKSAKSSAIKERMFESRTCGDRNFIENRVDARHISRCA